MLFTSVISGQASSPLNMIYRFLQEQQQTVRNVNVLAAAARTSSVQLVK